MRRSFAETEQPNSSELAHGQIARCQTSLPPHCHSGPNDMLMDVTRRGTDGQVIETAKRSVTAFYENDNDVLADTSKRRRSYSTSAAVFHGRARFNENAE